MKRTLLLWIIAFVITILTAYYQRTTGPTHPVSGKVTISNETLKYYFERTHAGDGNHPVNIVIGGMSINGELLYKRFRTDEEWTRVQMTASGPVLSGELPHQPVAGKLVYQVVLKSGNETVMAPNEPIIIRFRDDVPWYILIPHIFVMFGALLLSMRTGLEFFNPEPALKKLTYWTLGLLIFGGMIFGPLVQKFAFGDYWTGFPFGTDLTDNKTLIAVVGWIVAAIAINRSKKPKLWVLIAALIMLIVYSIPHSVLGSELDYQTGKMRNIGLHHPRQK
jgi:hypothetical protein